MHATRHTHGRILTWQALGVGYLAVVALSANRTIAAGGATADSRPSATAVDLFTAISAGQLNVVAIPSDSRRITLQFTNTTDQPLSIRLPDAFGAVPVLAQVPQRNPQQQNQRNNPQANNNQSKAPQTLGSAFGNQNGNANGNGNGNGNGNRANGNRQGNAFGNVGAGQGFFNIPPEKTIVVKTVCVCLEHGNPRPTPLIPYEIRPLAEVSDNPQVRELLDLLGTGEYTQCDAQIAAWHLANNMSWKELAALDVKQWNGKRRPEFTAAEMAAAKRMVAELPSSKSKSDALPTATASASGGVADR